MELIHVVKGTTASNNGSITIDKDIWCGKYEVTQAEFLAVMGFNPSNFVGDTNRPVEKVTWFDAVKFCNELSTDEGLNNYYNISGEVKTGNNITSATVTENAGANGYRLPTLEEWQYCAKGGKDSPAYNYAGSNTADDVGWTLENSGGTTHAVGTKLPNYIGLYDMTGNVREWTNTSSGVNVFIMGGSYTEYSTYGTPNYMYTYFNYDVSRVYGFRVVRDYEEPTVTYTVTFESNGGSAVTAISNVASGSVITAPTAPTKTGSTFAGWYKESSLTTAWSFSSDTVTSNITLYAKWTANSYTVTFNSDGGSSVTSVSANYNTTITSPTSPTKTGYTFGGWYKETELTTAWNFAVDTVTDNITLYAKWQIVAPPVIENTMINNFNSIFRKDAYLLSLCQAISVELYQVEAICEKIYTNMFFDTLDEELGIPLWAKQLNVNIPENATIQTKRSLLSAKWRSKGKANEDLLQKVADSWANGEVKVIFSESGTISVSFQSIGGVPAHLEELDKEMNRVKPAHLIIDYIFNFLTWFLFESYNLNWDEFELRTLTWEEWEVQITKPPLVFTALIWYLLESWDFSWDELESKNLNWDELEAQITKP